MYVAPDGDWLLCQQQQRSQQENAAPASAPLSRYSPLLDIGGNEKTRGDKAATQTAFRSDPPIPVVLDTLERGENLKPVLSLILAQKPVFSRSSGLLT
jgi:hypothetical protein